MPGASIYNSVYYMIQDNQPQSSHYLAETLQIAGAIAMAVFLVDSLFHMLRAGKNRRAAREEAGERAAADVTAERTEPPSPVAAGKNRAVIRNCVSRWKNLKKRLEFLGQV